MFGIIGSNQVFLLAGHKRPDGDSMGAQAALAHILRDMGKTIVWHDLNACPPAYRFLPGIEADLARAKEPQPKPDATFLLDCSSTERVAPGFAPQGPTVCIDHHQTNQATTDVNIVDPAASSTGEMLYEILEARGLPLTEAVATCLYTSILTDTGSFRYSNTTGRVMAIAGRLIEAGADPAAIARACFENREPASLILEGAVLADLRYECAGRLVWSEIRLDRLAAHGGEASEPEDLVSKMRSARGVEVSILFKETPTGLRVSFRSKHVVDVAALAGRFEGGGHARAAGAELTGGYDDLRRQVLETARAFMAQ